MGNTVEGGPTGDIHMYHSCVPQKPFYTTQYSLACVMSALCPYIASLYEVSLKKNLCNSVHRIRLPGVFNVNIRKYLQVLWCTVQVVKRG